MVLEQIARPRDGRTAVHDARVLDAMRAVPRHLFVPEEARNEAYDDHPIPIGHGQTISQPYIVAVMTEQLALPPRARTLEIGTGSGYQTAVLARLAAEVFSIERVPRLAEEADRRLGEQGFRNVRIRVGDGFEGWSEHAPYDGILLTAAPPEIPPRLVDQLRPGGRLVAPVGADHGVQPITLVTKRADGAVEETRVMGARFVPMVPGVDREG
ncbi:MAG: protein-L-isoaspartate(D-aspartate) O-methyltransferase [Verrucomicrobiae bacterium]|nr:protein-L-isoaspartate(D-aspartate) O-methyltransferase [Verrucomicrobiae bacterium]